MAKEIRQQNSTASSAALQQARKNIYWQAGLAVVTIVLTLVIAFAMTAAWYTNIVQTSGLVFQAQAWGFDGKITVGEGSVRAAPGDEGIVSLTVVNDNDSMASVGVSVDKNRFGDAEMRKRLFLYVDTQQIRSGEVMSRVYLNSRESYTYTVFANDTLTLTEDTHSDAPLKWKWVYDMLGYYVLGTYDEASGRVTEQGEYLRPIEYDYDKATFEMVTNEDGTAVMQMKTVDGTTTPEAYLELISETDGYPNRLNTDDPDTKHGSYYLIGVDPVTGYNIYAYLCSYTEIQLANAYDTRLGEQAKQGTPATYPVSLNIAAQKTETTTLPITTLDGLNTALQMDTPATLQLSGDLTLTAGQAIKVPTTKSVTLDLNGHTITTPKGQNAVVAEPGSSLTMTNGTLKGVGNTDIGINAIGAQVVLNQMNIKGFDDGIRISDHDSTNIGLDSFVRIVDCTIRSEGTYSSAVFVSGNATASAQASCVIIEDSELYGTMYALLGNGSETRWGTDVQIINSKLSSSTDTVSMTIYLPQRNSTTNIVNSEIKGHTGICIKSGTVILNGSRVHGTGIFSEPAFTASGCSTPGDAVYIETNYSTRDKTDIVLQITDSTLTSTNASSLRVFDATDAPYVTVSIVSGSFKEAPPAAYIAPGSVADGTDVKIDETTPAP